jgi:hypothetical protein
MWWRWFSAPGHGAVTRVRYGCFGDNLTGKGDDPDDENFTAAAGSLGMAA